MIASVTQPPSLTVGRVTLLYSATIAVMVPLRLLATDKPTPVGTLAATVVVTLLGSVFVWWVYHKGSGRRDGLAVSVPLMVTMANGSASPFTAAMVTLVVATIAYALGCLVVGPPK